jgi:hypothetical protein
MVALSSLWPVGKTNADNRIPVRVQSCRFDVCVAYPKSAASVEESKAINERIRFRVIAYWHSYEGRSLGFRLRPLHVDDGDWPELLLSHDRRRVERGEVLLPSFGREGHSPAVSDVVAASEDVEGCGSECEDKIRCDFFEFCEQVMGTMADLLVRWGPVLQAQM